MRPIAILLLFAVPALAQPGRPEGDVKTLLASGQANERAWGAYLAAEAKDATVQPQLVGLLKDREAQVRAAAFDALIRTKASVDWKDLERLFASNPDDVIILLALHPKKHEQAMLKLLKGKTRLSRRYWRTIGNHLAARRTPGFAAHLMRDMPVTLTITIKDAGNGVIGIGGGAGGAFRGRLGRRNLRAGWPPIMRHSITENLSSLPLSAGRRPTGYARYRRHLPHRGTSAPVSERFDYLADLLERKTQALPLHQRYSENCTYDLPPFLGDKVEKAKQRIEDDYRATLALLAKVKLLTAEEVATLKPVVRVHVLDFRKKKEPALPKLQ